MNVELLERCIEVIKGVQGIHHCDLSRLVSDLEEELKSGINLRDKVEELLEANLAQHDEWNSLMNAHYELTQYCNALEADGKTGIRIYVDTTPTGDIVVPYIVPTDKSPNATLILDVV